ncbi:MAG: hypothetical protein BWY31_02302 [Lentisphaerae bacterium ADurb.Bin242]|nr:MAG: hypothetical protein BWY31_02302 [Lentisphaerae bacterium ADurb.Bin242]
MFKLKKWALIASLGLLASGVINAAPAVNVTAHFSDQVNAVRNDPKWLTGEMAIGQSFIPDGDTVSFLSANIFPAEKRQERVVKTGEKGKNLQITLKELQDGNPGNTIATRSDREAGVKVGALNLYRIDAPVTPGKSYLLEFRLDAPGAGDYYFWYQYGGNHYLKGDFYMNGQRRGGCDLDFAVYRPVEITPNAAIAAPRPPEILEIRFQEKPDRTRTTIFLSGPDGIARYVPVWSDDRTVLLGPLKLPVRPGQTREYRVHINTDGGQSPSVVIPFTLHEKN